MTPRQLKYYMEIARLRSFTRASAVLHIAQPALTRQMQLLEDEVGVKLLVRSDAGVGMTAAGALLYERAPALIDSYREVREQISALADIPRGSFRFGMPPSLFDLVTAPLASQYALRYPEVHLCITEGVSAELYEAVATGELDFALVSSTESTASLDGKPMLTEQLFLANAGGKPGEGPPITLDELAGVRLVSTRSPNAMRAIVDQAFHAASLRPKVVFETSSARLLASLAADGVAGAVLPWSAVASLAGQGRLQVRPVQGLSITWMLIHSRSRALTPSVEALLEMMLTLVHEGQMSGKWRGVTRLEPPRNS
jgi:LysR family nitrogen assimilation transcriptional regulator